MKQKLLFCFLLCFALFGVAFAQERTVSGKVKDSETGEGIPGVSVYVKGTSTGTTTDVNGDYKITVTEGAILVFQGVGFTKMEMPVGSQAVIDISMSIDTEALNEVVVTALGIERTKNELAYAAQKVDGEDISKIRDNNITNTLSGRVAGLDIKRTNGMGGSTNVVVRGFKSLSNSNQALFVVDGVPIENNTSNTSGQQNGGAGYDYGNAAADINPDDIASINVLKGAAATSLYGSRAANGVIMITTKKGSKGFGVTINTGVTFGVIDKSTFVKYQKEYGQGYGTGYGSPDGYFLYRDINGDGIKDLVSPLSEDASWGGRFNANQQVYQWDAFDPASSNFGKSTPWVAAANDPTTFFKTAQTSSHSIILDGGDDKGFFKIGYNKSVETGILPNSKLIKDYINFSASYKVSSKITATGAINVTNVKGNGRYGTGYDDNNVATNFRQWWPVNVDLKEQEQAYLRNKQNITWNWASPTNLKPIYWDNPYFNRFENYETDNRLRYFGYAMLNYKVTDWLNVMGRITLDAYNEFQEERIAVGSHNPSKYSRFDRSNRELNYDLILSFNKKFGDFSLRAIFGGSIRRTIGNSIFTSTNGGLVVPSLYSISNSLNPINPPTETYSELRVDGVYSNVTFGYKNFLYLDLSIRRDQSSSLPKGNNGYYYPSSSLSFVFSELLKEKFTWLTGGKLRVNYAEVGNSTSPYNIRDIYQKPTAYGSIPLFSVNGTKNNPNLKSEKTRSFEAGLEMNFLDGRVGFDFTFYKQNTINQIIPADVSRTTGYNAAFINAGNVQNKGIELQLYGTPIKTADFSWTINVNWTRNRNKVLELDDTRGINNLLLGTFQGGVTINAAKGEPYGTIRGSNFVYTNGKKTVEDGYYQISGTSNEIIGNINPKWLAGISNTLNYKGVSLSFLIDIKHGGSVFSLDQYYGLATGVSVETVGNNDLGNPIRNTLGNGGGIILSGVNPDGTPNTTRIELAGDGYGTFGYVYNPAAGFVYDASYVKLRQAALGYSLPKSIISKLGLIKGIEISVIGRNLWVIHKNLPNADPEDGLGSGNIQGYQVGSYPLTRNIGFNVKFKL